MNAETSEAIIKAVNPAECRDFYYPSEEGNVIQCFPTVIENRYSTALTSLNFGSSSTLLFNPDSLLDKIVLSMTLPVGAGVGASAYVNAALATGWGYAMIDSVLFRYGGSQTYQISGDQMLVDALIDCENQSKVNDLMNLGGQALTNTQLQSTTTSVGLRSAHVFLKLPHNTPSAQEQTLGLPTDLLSSPVQIVIRLKPATGFFVPVNGAVGAVPAGLESGYVNFRQIHMTNQSNLLSRRANMNEEALSYPLKYFSNTVFRTSQDNVAAGDTVQLNLSGFRSGSVGDIVMWITTKDDAANGRCFNFVTPQAVEVKVNGLIYFTSSNKSNELWNLIDYKHSSSVNYNYFDITGAVVNSRANWTIMPFAQPVQRLFDGESINVISTGLSVQNSVVNCSVTMEAAGNYVFNFAYRYNGVVLLFTGGSCDYQF
jgi:hypothetical protein